MTDELTALKRRIHRKHARAQRNFRTDMTAARQLGMLLIEAKAMLPYGQWKPWASEHLPMSLRSAQLYMRLAATDVRANGLEGAQEAMRGRGRARNPNARGTVVSNLEEA